MRIFIKRGDQEYGPYPISSLAQMVQSGNIVPHDQARREDTGEITTVAQLLAPPAAAAPVPAPIPPAPTPAPTPAPQAAPVPVYTPPQAAYTPPVAAAPVYAPPSTPVANPGAGPTPPGMQWWLVLILTFVTCSIFGIVWAFIQANFVKKIDPKSKAVLFLLGYLGLNVLSIILSVVGAAGRMTELALLSTPVSLAGTALFIWNAFQIRASLLDYYNRVENINLRLSPIVTFFFSVFYFQHHFARIAKWKATGQLEPQTYKG